MQIQLGSFSDTAATRQRTEAAGVAGQGAAVQQALEAAVAPDAYGEAVIVTLSEAGQKQAEKNEGVGAEASDTPSILSLREIDERVEAFRKSAELLNSKSSELEESDVFYRSNMERYDYYKEQVSFLESVEPEASKVLTGKEAEDTLRMLNSFRQGDVTMSVSESGRRSWGVGDKVYALYPDGTLTVGKAGVPESEEERQYLLDNARKQLADLGASILSARRARAGTSAQ